MGKVFTCETCADRKLCVMSSPDGNWVSCSHYRSIPQLNKTMTREEAIKILKEEAEFLYGGDEPYNKLAFDMAIDALSRIKADCIYKCKFCTHCERYEVRYDR